jgi:hypothetical protein
MSLCSTNWPMAPGTFPRKEHKRCLRSSHRDRTRVQMLAKIFPHLKVKCLLFMGPTLGFDTKQKTGFLIKFGVFLQLKQDSDNIIHS